MDFSEILPKLPWVAIGLWVFVMILMGLLNASDRWSKAAEFGLAAKVVGIPAAVVGLISLGLGLLLDSGWEPQTLWLFVGGLALAAFGWAASPSAQKNR